MRTVLILHGWSDTSASFEPLAGVLRANGLHVVPLWLGDYISMEDDVAIPDVARRMEEVLAAQMAAGAFAAPFDMVVHSTGGLVARQWLAAFDARRPTRWLQRLVMLAPANHGSRLASLGKSMLGRLVKGFNHWFHTGTLMLHALELGSPYQWQLALADVLRDPGIPWAGAPVPAPYGPQGCLPFVITGIKGYDTPLRRPLNEDGADGTVRAAAANLTSHGLTLDFCQGGAEPAATVWERIGPIDRFAFAALGDVDHGSIVDGGASVLAPLLQALRCPMEQAAYDAIRDQWLTANDALMDGGTPGRHQYFQLNTFVVDDLGQPVADHFIEFFSSSGKKRDAALAIFRTEVIEHVHVNTVNGACRNFYLDRTDLVTRFYAAQEAGKPRELRLSISASPPGPNVSYFDSTREGASGEFAIHLADDSRENDRWLRRNSTHYLKIIIPRRPAAGVFRMRLA